MAIYVQTLEPKLQQLVDGIESELELIKLSENGNYSNTEQESGATISRCRDVDLIQ